MNAYYVAVEPCGCIAGVTTLRNPDAVRDFLNEMRESPAEVVSMPEDEFRARDMFCSQHPAGPPYWPSNQAGAA